MEPGTLQDRRLLPRDYLDELRRHPPDAGVPAGRLPGLPGQRHAGSVRRDPVLRLVRRAVPVPQIRPHAGLRIRRQGLRRRVLSRQQDPRQRRLRQPDPVRRPGDQRPGGVGQPGLPDHHGIHSGQRRAHRGRGPDLPPGGRRADRPPPGGLRRRGGGRPYDGPAVFKRGGRGGLLRRHEPPLRGHQRPDLQAQLPAGGADEAAADYHGGDGRPAAGPV